MRGAIAVLKRPHSQGELTEETRSHAWVSASAASAPSPQNMSERSSSQHPLDSTAASQPASKSASQPGPAQPGPARLVVRETDRFHLALFLSSHFLSTPSGWIPLHDKITFTECQCHVVSKNSRRYSSYAGKWLESEGV